MLVARKIKGPRKKKKSSNLMKKKKPSWLTVSLLLWQEQTSNPPVGLLKKPGKIIENEN